MCKYRSFKVLVEFRPCAVALTHHIILNSRSVLAGASDRPILLTVTPKNGINKGQKQIVVLTKNTATGSTTAGLARPPGSPQTVIQGSQVLPQQQLGSIQPGSAQQHTGSPQQQLQQESKSVHLSPRPATVSASLGGAQSSPSIPQLVVRQQALSSPSRPALVPQGAQQVTAGVRQVSQQSIQQQTSSQVTKSIPNTFQGGQPTIPGVQSRVMPHQMTKVVKSISSPAVRAPFSPTTAQAPQSAPAVRAAGTPRASSPQVLRGQLIQTPQGQMLVQGDRRILLGPNSVVQGGKLVLTAAQMAALTGATPPRQTVLQGPQTPQSPTVIRQQIVRQKPAVQQAQTSLPGPQASVPLLQGVVSQPQNSPTLQARGLPIMQSAGTPSANSQPTRLILGGSQQSSQHVASNGTVTSIASSPLASAGTPETPASEANASVSRILAALHNRGLVSQQNGKFYYVGGGDQRKQQAVPISGGGQSQVQHKRNF